MDSDSAIPFYFDYSVCDFQYNCVYLLHNGKNMVMRSNAFYTPFQFRRHTAIINLCFFLPGTKLCYIGMPRLHDNGRQMVYRSRYREVARETRNIWRRTQLRKALDILQHEEKFKLAMCLVVTLQKCRLKQFMHYILPEFHLHFITVFSFLVSFQYVFM